MPSLDINFFRLKISSNEFSEWLNTSDNIFFLYDVKNTPKSLTYCEALFDKNVLPIKKFVHDIGDISKLIHKEKKLIKRLISLGYDQNNKNIIN